MHNGVLGVNICHWQLHNGKQFRCCRVFLGPGFVGNDMHGATQDAPTEVWGTHFTARIAPDAINKWLSGFFSREVQLRWVGPQMTRRVKRHNTVPLSFADGYPYLLANEASLRDLQQRCPASVKMEQFRPNLVVSGASAWEEDSWKVIRIGDVVFDVVKPCSRCIFTTVSPEKGQKHPAGEPLKTLQSFRTAQDNGDVDFGQNLIARNSGVIRLELYQGTLIFVSHDREFVSSLATRILEITPERVIDFSGNYEDYLRSKGIE